MPDEPIPGPTPTGYQRTQGGGVAWVPPSAEHLSKLLPQYEIEALCGRGGMGAVYKGKQKTLDRAVAIKILPPDLDDEDASYTQRFKNEAKIMAKLDHPAIVPVYDFGETSEGQFYFVMSFIDGTDVAKMIQSQGRLPPEHALAIAAHVCDALKYAHANGVIHRDIKPANVLINMDGQVRVADFGLAKMDDPSQSSGITKTGTAMGTPDFVAPETLTMGVDVDGRADLYAVGVMLYQMLTGNVPRGAWLPPSVQVPGVDRRFDPIVMKAMQFDREHRYQTAGEFRRALDVILTTPVVKEGGESSAAIPKQSLPQKPVAKGPLKPMGKSANVPVRQEAAAAPDPNHQSQIVNQKSKAPLFIGIAAVAAIAIGALVLRSSRREEASDATGHTSASSQANGSAGAPSLVTSAATGASSAPIKVREEPKPAPVIVNSAPKPATPKPETLKPAPEKKEEPKPVASVPTPPPPATPTKESPQPARLPDPAKWVKVFDTPERASALGPSVKILDQGFEFTGTVILPTNEVTNSAIRMTIRRGTQCIIGFRNRSGKAVTAMVDRGVRIKKSAERADSLQLLSLLPSDAMENKVEVTLVENVMLISVDGKAMGSSVIEDDPTPGRISLNSITGAVVRDIAWQSLDVPLDEKLASAKALEQKQVAEAAASVPPPVPEHWVDATASVKSAVGPAVAEEVPGGWRAATLVANTNVPSDNFRNAALKVRHVGNVGLQLRHTINQGKYNGQIGDFTANVNFSDSSTTPAVSRELAKGKLPQGFDRGEPHETLFAAQGDDLSLWVDGHLVVRVADTHLTAGRMLLRIEKGTVIEKVEYAEPPDDRIIAAKQQEQAKQAAVIAAVATIPELATLDEQFKKLTTERVTAPFEAEVATLNTSYVGGLDRKLAEEKKAGHLDSVLAIEAEKKLIPVGSVSDRASPNPSSLSWATAPIPSAEDDATSTTTPAVLKGLRQIYRDAYAKIEATRTANMKALTDPLTTRLKLLESDLTKKDRIADAKTVKEYREGLQANSYPQVGSNRRCTFHN